MSMARSKDHQTPSRRDNPSGPVDRSTDNGDVKTKTEYAPRGCPVGEMFLLWGIVACLAVGVPFFATRIPTASRTDLAWWMTGVVYQVPPLDQLSDTDQARNMGPYFKVITNILPDLKSIGIDAVRLQDFFPKSEDGSPLDYYGIDPSYGNLKDFETFIDKLDTLGMNLLIDLPLAYTSVAHTWFWEDRKKKALDTTYLWADKPIEDQDHDTYFTHVLETWIRRGVDGFIFLEYDVIQLRNRSRGDSINHIETLDPHAKKIRNLVNLTTCFRELFNYYQEEYEGTVFFAVDVTTTDERVWRAVYEAGADTILSHDTVLSPATLNSGRINPYSLQNNVQNVLARAPEDKWKSWEMFSPLELDSISEDHQMLLNLIHLMLPGSAYLAPVQLPMIAEDKERQGPMTHFKEVISWRSTPAGAWGATEVTLTDDDIFSFARFAYGKSFARYLIITNFGTTAQNRNFTMHTDRLKIPDTGKVKYSQCGSGGSEEIGLSPYQLDSVIYLNNTVVQPLCGLLVELTLKPFL